LVVGAEEASSGAELAPGGVSVVGASVSTVADACLEGDDGAEAAAGVAGVEVG
jgi:hypothetical protein